MTKQEIIQIMDQEYNDKINMVSVKKLKEKLEETRSLFPKSFDSAFPNPQGIGDKFKFLIKRILRKCLRFLLKPYADQMAAYEKSMYELQSMIIDALDKAVDAENRE